MLERAAQLPFLNDLSAEQLGLLAPYLTAFQCPRESVIFEQGQPATHFYMIVRGVVAIHYKPYDGPRMLLTRLQPGDVVGWSSVVGSPTYTSSACSEAEVEALRMSGAVLRKLCLQHAALGSVILDRLAEIVSGRWENSHAQVQVVLSQDLDAKE